MQHLPSCCFNAVHTFICIKLTFAEGKKKLSATVTNVRHPPMLIKRFQHSEVASGHEEHTQEIH